MVTGKVKQKNRLLKSSPQDERFLSFTDTLSIIPCKNLNGTLIVLVASMRVQVATKTTTVTNRSLCINSGTFSDQYNSCTNESRCAQFGISNYQNIRCSNDYDCNQFSISITQNIGCSNESSCSQFGVSSTENAVCANRSGCATNSGFDGPGTTQNTVCQSSI